MTQARLNPHDLTLRFWGNVNFFAPNGCWEWTGSRSPRGYGRVTIVGHSSFAHRVALSAATLEPLSSKLLALHSCDNPPCVNPSHLRWGTNADNNADMVKRGRTSAGMPLQSHCRKGHELVEGNLYYTKGRRRCRACVLTYQKQRRAG